MAHSRRDFLRRAGMTTLGALPAMNMLACGPDAPPDETDQGDTPFEYPDLEDYSWEDTPGPERMFSHGVASGDPLAQAVLLWTRVSPDTTQSDSISVWWEIAHDQAFELRLAAGEVSTDASRDWTVKVDASGLLPGQTYYYRFFAQGIESPMGRTKTAAADSLDRMRLAFCSCSNYTRGFFMAYREIGALADIDLVLHLGDYIYEYGSGGATWQPGPETMTDLGRRVHDPPKEITTLEDYRRRYAQYRTDLDLQEAHRQHPFVVVWDDHESANDAWRDGAQNHTNGTEGSWKDRLSAAQRAWLEWMPVREQEDARIWRAFSFGDLLDLVMLDTRIWGRDLQDSDPGVHADPERTLLGDDQEAWMLETLRDSSAAWRVLGQQVMMAHLRTPVGGILNPDQWDGYEGSRSRLFDALATDVEDVVVLTGDIHTSWANDLVPDPDADEPEVLAVEFVTPGVTSSGISDVPAFARNVRRANPHIQWLELSKRGYVVLDITRERIQAAWFHFETITDPDATTTFAAAYHTVAGSPGLVEDDSPAPAPDEVAALAP